MIKLFTHTDLDGIGCEVVARFLAADAIDVEYCENNDVDSKICNFMNSSERSKFQHIWITDLSIKATTANLLNYRKGDAIIMLVDHHASSDHLKHHEWARIEIEDNCGVKQCGTSLLFKLLFTPDASRKLVDNDVNVENLKTFVELVRLWDTVDWKNFAKYGTDARNLNDLFNAMSRQSFVDSMLCKMQSACEFPEYIRGRAV